MLLKALNVTNRRGDSLSLPLDDVSGGYVVKEIEGLGPAKATLVASKFANMDGEQYHSATREPRNIIVKLGLDPDYGQQSVYDLRSQLYNFFMPKTTAMLKMELFDKFSESVIDQNLVVEIQGRIESFEPSIFSKDPTVDLSIMCYKPDFIVPEPVELEGETVDDLTEMTISYKGTIETGLVFEMYTDRTISDFTIYNRLPNNILQSVTYQEELIAGDTVVISSVPGSKFVTRKRGGVESAKLYAISPQSNWLEIHPGENNFRVYTDGDPLEYTVEFNERYGGL